MGWQSWLLGTNEGGVENWAYYNDDTGELVCQDRQPGHAVQSILDENARWRRNERERSLHKMPLEHRPKGRKVASIPITMWVNWRREWQQQRCFTWQTFLMQRLHDPQYKNLLTTEQPFPERYVRDEAAWS